MRAEHEQFLSMDEQGASLHLMLLNAAGGSGSAENGSAAGSSEASEKEARRKTKAAEKQARAALATGRKEAITKVMQTSAANKKIIGKAAEASVEVDVGIDVDITTLVGSVNLPASAADDGALAALVGERKQFYLTTAINYTNGNPHIGHAYEAISADVISRYQRLCGRDVFFLTGTDEHGQKIANTAEAHGVTPLELCNTYAGNFQALNKRLLISNSFYIRTTMPMHHECSQRLWQRCAEAGDIYLDNYEGWYDEREETFVSENDAKLAGYKDKYGEPLKKMSEASYFFRMGKYRDWLAAHIADHPEFVQPEALRLDILKRIKEELGDLSISRTTFSWGIPMPDGFDKAHVMYVWFDALSNYLSGVHALDPGNDPRAKFWPADVHIIGKDIIWFHCVIWPCMLRSAGLALPKRVFAHGFITAGDGRKMSKTLGNVVDPHAMCNRYPVDTFRWYMMREAAFGSDLAFSECSLMAMHNAELCDTLGNLVHRTVSLCDKYNAGTVPAPLLEGPAAVWAGPFDVEKLRSELAAAFADCAVQQACILTMAALRDTNKFLTEAEPWKMGEQRAAERLEVVRTSMEAVYVLAHFLAPVIPMAGTAVFHKLGQGPVPIPTLRTDYRNLAAGTRVAVGRILFKKMEAPEAGGEEEALAAGTAGAAGRAGTAAGKGSLATGKGAAAAADVAAAGGGEKGNSKGKGKGGGAENGAARKGGGGGAAEDSRDETDPSRLDIRVGVIMRAWPHPESEKLFCEEIDIGETAPRLIASGLRAFYSTEDLQERRVLVLANLKARPMAGFKSEGMVLCASDAAHTTVAFIDPPAAAAIGTRIVFPGYVGEPAPAVQITKKKTLEKVMPRLRTDAAGVPGCDGTPFVAGEAGACASPLPDAVVS